MKTNANDTRIKSLRAQVEAFDAAQQQANALKPQQLGLHHELRTAPTCATCGKSIATGSPLKWDRNTRQTYHADCN